MSQPIFLDLSKIKFPVTAIVSILHRVSGVAMFLAMPFILAWMFMVTFSQSSFAIYMVYSNLIWVKIIYLLILFALTYHAFAGLRHMYHDISHDHSLASSRLSAWVVLFLTGLAFIALIYRMFFLG